MFLGPDDSGRLIATPHVKSSEVNHEEFSRLSRFVILLAGAASASRKSDRVPHEQMACRSIRKFCADISASRRRESSCANNKAKRSDGCARWWRATADELSALRSSAPGTRDFTVVRLDIFPDLPTPATDRRRPRRANIARRNAPRAPSSTRIKSPLLCKSVDTGG